MSSKRKKPKLIRRGKLATMLKVPWPTVKYYQEIGLFQVAGLTPNGQNLFNLDETRNTYSLIKSLKKRRLTIEEIKNRIIIETL